MAILQTMFSKYHQIPYSIIYIYIYNYLILFGVWWYLRRYPKQMSILIHIEHCHSEHPIALSWLVGGFKHFLFFTIYGIILPIDSYFSTWLKPPTRSYSFIMTMFAVDVRGLPPEFSPKVETLSGHIDVIGVDAPLSCTRIPEDPREQQCGVTRGYVTTWWLIPVNRLEPQVYPLVN